MTRDEIILLKAGRDLDTTVAVEIMGYGWITHGLRFSAELTAKWLAPRKDLEQMKGIYKEVKPEEWYSIKLRDNHDEAVPLYSTDTTAAKDIIAQMNESGYEYSCEKTAEGNFNAVFIKSDGTDVISAIGDTEPEAISKAALMSMV